MLRCVGDLTGRRRVPARVRNAKREERTGEPIADDRHSRDSAPRRHGSSETLDFTPKLGASEGRLALEGDGYDAGDHTSGGDSHKSASSEPETCPAEARRWQAERRWKRTGNIARLIDACNATDTAGRCRSEPCRPCCQRGRLGAKTLTMSSRPTLMVARAS